MNTEELTKRLEAAQSVVEDAEDSLDSAEREVNARRAELKNAEFMRDNAKRTITERRQQIEILSLALEALTKR